MSPSTRPSVNVLVSSYNYAPYVVDAVRSALTQSEPPALIIVVDDGSDDGSQDLLQRHFGQEPTIRLIAQPNQGQLVAWMTAFAHAPGDVIALLDSDDVWEPDYLRRVLDVYEARPEIDFIYANMQLFGQVDRPMYPPGPDRDLGLSVLLGAYVHRWQGTATSAMSLRRGLVERLFMLPGGMAAEWKSRPDDCLVYGGEILGAHKYYLGTPLVRHRQHGSNAKNEFTRAPHRTYRYLMRSEQMLEFYRQQAGVTPRWLRMAKAEFRTKPSPTFAELRAYRWLLGQAPLPWWKRLEQWTALWAHYLQGLRRR
ncbi:MAG: glycosyltransferase family A protein [Lysobacter sp.]